jgi:hypothetical protein
MSASIGDLHRSISADLVGRERQLAAALAVLEAGRDLLLEGPPERASRPCSARSRGITTFRSSSWRATPI